MDFNTIQDYFNDERNFSKVEPPILSKDNLSDLSVHLVPHVPDEPVNIKHNRVFGSHIEYLLYRENTANNIDSKFDFKPYINRAESLIRKLKFLAVDILDLLDTYPNYKINMYEAVNLYKALDSRMEEHIRQSFLGETKIKTKSPTVDILSDLKIITDADDDLSEDDSEVYTSNSFE